MPLLKISNWNILQKNASYHSYVFCSCYCVKSWHFNTTSVETWALTYFNQFTVRLFLRLCKFKSFCYEVGSGGVHKFSLLLEILNGNVL